METEVKIRIDDRQTFEQRLPSLGFTCRTLRTFERNILFDTPDRRLRNSRQILRIRQYGSKWVVTHKRVPADDTPEALYKRRIETETTVEDGPALCSIFESLGYRAAFVYEKWRTEWEDGEGHCVLDETPLGLYVELEGPGEWIDRTARSLQIDQSQYVKLSYGRIFEQWRDQNGSSIQNFTFAEVPESLR